ncbi:MAG TPA: TonB-dependent receptor plug domain-containing protein [Sphingopyxis sp.]|uniref:TonB-dependent receptor plug domain-containing protein n=1 Tax=Sphingopyxis sp. TaxID=1908224 RepID=UPI002E3399EA|nr:TonB-dependent receptor plug domain-containing protein [Sphingopyxis sp.]HEX2811379.1 TonB-dependent receptor plug domain-containing protein [Sphingopyxis sp.]
MKFAVSLAAVAAVLSAVPAAAQEAPPTGDTPPPASTDIAASANSAARQVFTPADFARYAPKNAYDMLAQVPGFSIRDNENLRGLGQATGNVLFNGERPSNKADDMYTQLSRIPAGNVERIEIVDGATLDIPGLSGQVANIVYRADSFSGQFSWKPEFRAHYTDPLLTRADVSVRGRTGEIEYEAALSNDDSARSGAGGPTLIYDGTGSIIERRKDIWNTHYDTPKLSGRLTWDPPGDSVANLGGHIQRKYDRYYEDGVRTGPGQPDRLRTVYENADSWNYELGGDYQFGVGPGKLKLIGLRRFSHEPYSQEIVTTPDDGTPATGDRFAQTGNLGETIARGEYQWKMFGGDWQLSGEGAFNTLGNVASIATLDPSGAWIDQPFDGGTGGVSEDRYEGLLSFGRKLTGSFSFQLIAGAEHSTITQTGLNGLTRSFFRPKGSLTLAWAPSADFDASLKIRRRVLQLSFYDFLARAFLNDGNENQSNNDLRPQQDWSYELEINKKLGAWGSTKLYFVYRDVEDRVDVIPIGLDGEAVGNIAKAKAGAVEWTSTINFDPAGLKGVKLDTSLLFQTSTLRDPFTGEKRQWSGFTDTALSADLRHDIPGSDWAWGGHVEYSHVQPNYRRNQTDKVWEGPIWASVFVEHKNVMGLTVRASINNITNARSRRDRTVYEGLRGASEIAFVEERDRLIGPIFAFSVRGKF